MQFEHIVYAFEAKICGDFDARKSNKCLFYTGEMGNFREWVNQHLKGMIKFYGFEMIITFPMWLGFCYVRLEI
jgi:hypothetical protein